MRHTILILFTIFFFSCSKDIEPINYGDDACEFCSMTIVDRTHASQVVTNKGKNFKFDSSECMIHYVLEKSDEQNLLHILSANYLNPGNMIDATSATFIISEEIPSPMGAFLSAIESKNEAENLQKEFGGNLYSWEEVKVEIGSQEKYFH